jgi:hypothetical protein
MQIRKKRTKIKKMQGLKRKTNKIANVIEQEAAKALLAWLALSLCINQSEKTMGKSMFKNLSTSSMKLQMKMILRLQESRLPQ